MDEFFIRLDKLQNHNRKCHTDQLDLQHCRVFGLRTPRPELCRLCQYRFQGMTDQYNYIKDHHTAPVTLSSGLRKMDILWRFLPL
jgi:hypothetical protein